MQALLDSDGPTTDAEALPLRPSEPLVVQPRYRLGALLGRGGMGEVVSAYDSTIGRDVAIKSLLAPSPTPRAVGRFLREARIQGRLDHPAIVPVHELAYDDQGHPYFVMKKVRGKTLDKLLGEGRSSRRKLLHAFADVCLAIEFAHSRGVIHRDIKPANIVLGDFGEVYVLDWGIARSITDREEASHANPGTPGYMSPEQIEGVRVDERADVYSLGCVLYELLAGRSLHPRGDAACRTTIVGVDARPSRIDPDIAPELDALCVRATFLDRDQRPGSARELGEAVQRYLDGDRDGELRHKLAEEHLEAARSALAHGYEDEARRVAMREVGQALALEPALDGAAALLGHLMLAPPAQTPAPVAQELAIVDRETTRGFTRNLLSVHGSAFVTMPILWLFGVHDALYFALALTLAALGFAGAVVELRTGRPLAWFHDVALIGMFALTARMFTPFLIAPALVAVNVLAFAFHPAGARLRPFLAFAASSVVAVLAVYALELAGVLSRTTTWRDGALVLRSPLAGIEHFPVPAALCVYLATIAITAGLVAFSTARLGRTARERVHVQAWQVRQLLG